MVSHLPTWLLLSQEDAWDTIQRETRKSRDLETGGILIGLPITYLDASAVAVLVATGPGPKAERSAISFAPDHETLGEELERWREHYSRYQADFVGIWHKHPAGVPVPTPGDLQQAQGILGDPDYVLPGGGILLPITQLKRENCTVRAFYLLEGQVEPVELECVFVETAVLKELLDETLAAPSTVRRSSQVTQSSTQTNYERSASRWGKLPTPPPPILKPYDVATGEGQIIIGEFSVIDDRSPEPTSSEKAVETPPESMAWASLNRQVQRIRQLAQRYKFEVKTQESESRKLDYVELVFDEDVYVPQLPRTKDGRRPAFSGDEASDEDEERRALPSPGERINAILIVFSYNYPTDSPAMWVCGERHYPVNRETLRSTGASSLAQEVETLLRWLFSESKAHLPGLIEANVEYLLKQGAHLVRDKAETVVHSMDELITKLEKPNPI